MIKFLDNFKIRTKLFIIFVFCVFVPVLLTNAGMYFFIKQSAEEQQKIQMENMIERIVYDFDKNINDAVAVSNYLYTDSVLDNFLRCKYESPYDYYRQYVSLMRDNVIKFYYTAQSVFSVRIYTDNASMIKGGHFFSTDSAKAEGWYYEFCNSQVSLSVIPYFNPKNRLLKLEPSRKISVVRRLDYFNKKDWSVLKLDLDYAQIQTRILQEGDFADIYITDGEKILFASSEKNTLYDEFRPASEIKLKSNVISHQLTSIGTGWQVIVTYDRPEIVLELKNHRLIWMLLAVFNLIFPTVVIIIVNRSFSRRLLLTEKYILKVRRQQFEIIDCHEGRDEIGNLIRSYNLMVTKIRELIEVVFKEHSEKQALEILKKQAELNALHSQINPHFLFNTLESIRMRSVIKDEDETAEIIEELALLMRENAHWGEDFITLEKELDYAKHYMNIQKYRFGDKLDFSFYIHDECKGIKVPKFGIVTFIENACIHGVENSKGNCMVSVIAAKNDGNVSIEIIDNGSGINEEKLAQINKTLSKSETTGLSGSENIGILNAYLRFKLYYGDDMEFYIDSAPEEGTEICIIFPEDIKKED
ncbi:MAG: sensor histidine kinase [Oscillospiraceae bacterium]|nr:sensor histidine kinase [Oscillospiraceae bacterium]